jgi:hypothetical protein
MLQALESLLLHTVGVDSWQTCMHVPTCKAGGLLVGHSNGIPSPARFAAEAALAACRLRLCSRVGLQPDRLARA